MLVASVAAPEREDRAPIDLAIVIDTSGSMQVKAEVSGEAEAEQPQHSLSVLDVVLHAVKTVVHMLGSQDRLALVTYADDAHVVMGFTQMDRAGRARAQAAARKSVADGQTNLWGGLRAALELIKLNSRPGVMSTVMLLTDGVPNFDPPDLPTDRAAYAGIAARGENAQAYVYSLRRYVEGLPGGCLPCVINTFGFGYELDSELLLKLAEEGDGLYNFIPDVGMVGTAFVNVISNTLVYAARRAVMRVEPGSGTELAGVIGSRYTERAGGYDIEMGALQYGESKDAVVVLRDLIGAPAAHVTLRYEGGTASARRASDAAPLPTPTGPDEERALYRQWGRADFVDAIRLITEAATSSIGTAQERAKQLADRLRSLATRFRGDELLSGLAVDAEGQVTEAVSKCEWYERWGKHYLPSLRRAHQIQQCSNFKDPGVQSYGGTAFRAMQELGDNAYVALPPPCAAAAAIDKIPALTALGFPEDHCVRALAAAHGDPQLATQYLLEGIPARPPPPPAAAAAPAYAQPAPVRMQHYHNNQGP